MRADLELVRRCVEGDPSAFEELYRTHAPRLYGLLIRMTGSTDDADDLLQEVFLHAYRRLGSFRGESALGTWLYRLATNHCLDFLRGRQNKMTRVTDSLDDGRPTDTWALRPVAPHTGGVIDLQKAIAQLPPGCREAFVLHDVEGFEHAEIGTMLGISPGTSKSQVHKARLRLRALLQATTP